MKYARLPVIFFMLCALLAPTLARAASAGSLIKASGGAVYYLGSDGKRYVFPNEKTFKTWYADFKSVVTVSDAELASIPLGGNVTYRPGVKMIKITTDPKVYAVDARGTLRWVQTEAVAVALFGPAWNKLVEDVEDAFFINYTIGAPIGAAADYDRSGIQNRAPSINADKGFVQNERSAYSLKTIDTAKGTFDVHVVSFAKEDYTMISAVAFAGDCARDCTAKPLDAYVQVHGADFGIHGSYFCPPDYSGCTNEINSFLAPFFDTETRSVTNAVKYRFHTGPLLAVDTSGVYRYYHRSKDFGSSVSEFERENGVTLQAQIANYPSLLENRAVVVDGEDMDEKQRTAKGYRGAIGYNDTTVYLAIAKAATVPDMAYIMQALGATYAMNLDGGGSSALYYGGAYKVGPGRKLPNAILFKRK